MDASQYLRRLAEQCPKTVSRNACVDASLYTQMKGMAATTTYISPVTVPGSYIPDSDAPVLPLACCTASPAFGLGTNGAVEAVKPPAGCPSQGVCEFFTNRYTNPTIELPGCKYTTYSTSYISACVIPCVQSTPAEQSQAVKTRVDRDMYACC
jgi:hypothetical protein